MTLSELGKQYAEIREKLDALAVQVDALNAQKKNLEIALLDRMITDGVPSFKQTSDSGGVLTISIKTQKFPSCDDVPGLITVMESAGLADLVKRPEPTVDFTALRKHLEEQQKLKVPVPEELTGKLKFFEKHSISARKAG